MARVYQERLPDGTRQTRVDLNDAETRQANVIGGCKCGLPGFECRPHGMVTTINGEVRKVQR